MRLTPTLAFAFLPAAAFAHGGEFAHLHPHGIQYGWIIACAVCFIGGLVLARVRGGRK